MAHFEQNFIDLRLPQKGNIRITKSELIFVSDLVSENIVVPVGTKTDLGSIPSILQWAFPKDGKAVLGYVTHDYLYQKGIYSRSKSDDILEEAMKVLGVSWWRRKSVRSGLAVGGWFSWNKHRRNDDDS